MAAKSGKHSSGAPTATDRQPCGRSGDAWRLRLEPTQGALAKSRDTRLTFVLGGASVQPSGFWDHGPRPTLPTGRKPRIARPRDGDATTEQRTLWCVPHPSPERSARGNRSPARWGGLAMRGGFALIPRVRARIAGGPRSRRLFENNRLPRQWDDAWRLRLDSTQGALAASFAMQLAFLLLRVGRYGKCRASIQCRARPLRLEVLRFSRQARGNHGPRPTLLMGGRIGGVTRRGTDIRASERSTLWQVHGAHPGSGAALCAPSNSSSTGGRKSILMGALRLSLRAPRYPATPPLSPPASRFIPAPPTSIACRCFSLGRNLI